MLFLGPQQGFQSSSCIRNDVAVELCANDDVSNLSKDFGNMSSPSKVKSIEASSLYRTSSIALFNGLEDDLIIEKDDMDCSSSCSRGDSSSSSTELALNEEEVATQRSSSRSSFRPVLQASIGGLKRTFHIKGTISQTHTHTHMNIYIKRLFVLL